MTQATYEGKHLVRGLVTVSDSEFMTIMVGNMVEEASMAQQQ